MKRCSECWQAYEDSFNFCETDGQALFTVEEVIAQPSPAKTVDAGSQNRTALTTGLIGAMAGIVLCLAVFTVYSFLQVQVDPRPAEVPTYTSQRQQPIQQVRSESARPTEDTPTESNEAEATETELPEPSPVHSQEAQEAPEARMRLNQGPVSTGQRNAPQAGMQTVIEMTDGSSVVVDAAWQDEQGIWYRRGGLVSYIDTRRVKAITARAEPKNSPTENQ